MDEKEMFFSAIIVAAGDSVRMKSSIRKPFLKLNNKHLCYYSLKTFEELGIIDEIIFVGKKEDEKKISEIKEKYNFNKLKKFAIGGNTRQESVFSGIKKISSKTSHIFIHDVARPLISKKEVLNVAKKVLLHDAATLYTHVKDTVKFKKENFVEKSLEREKLACVQTPQVFERNLYFKAMEKALRENKNYTDDCQLIENLNQEVFLVNGSYSNIKITSPEDLYLAEILLEKRGESKKHV